MRVKTYISSLICLLAVLAVSTVIAVSRGGKRLDSRAETLPAVANANGLFVTDHAIQHNKCAEDESKHNFSFLRINWGEVVGVGRADGDANPITQGWHLSESER